MSTPNLENILKLIREQGLSDAMLTRLTEEKLSTPPEPDGQPLSQSQKMMPTSNARSQEVATSDLEEKLRKEEAKNKELEEKLERVVAERNQARAEAERRKVHAKELIRFCTQLTDKSTQEVQRMLDELRRLGSDLDICFCIDGTGSMAECIKGVKRCIVKVSQNIAATTGMTARFGLVIYRDYGDSHQRHQVWNFGSSYDLEQHLNSVTATGGGDGPEDCFGGLWAALTRVTWKAPSKIIVWMGDAPQHGLMYSGGVGDTYPGGDPEGRTAVDIFTELKRQHVILVFCKLTSYTDRMCAQLKQEIAPFGPGLFLEYNVSADMNAFLTVTIHTTASNTVAHGGSSKGIEKPYSLAPAAWSDGMGWGPYEEGEVLSFSSYRGGELHPLLDLLADGPNTDKKKITCQMTLNPVEKGEMRFAFYAKIKGGVIELFTGPKKCMIKESRYEGSHNTKKALVDQAHIQTVAAFLASDFTAKLKKKKIQKEINYVHVEILRFSTRPEGKNYFSLEPFITGDYKKFNNNNGYVDKDLEAAYPILQTFSHFTYSYSRGMVMVVDLQGVAEGDTFKLTDPAIHTAEPKKCLPDSTNLGTEGMAAFLKTHKCNEFCQLMELKMSEEIGRMSPLDITEAEDEDPTESESLYETLNS